MKKLLVVISLALLLFSCKNGGTVNQMENQEETGPFSLIGTWEAEGELFNDYGKKFIYECTLIFDESKFTETTHSRSEDDSIDFTSRMKGSYTQDEDLISGTWYQLFDDGSTTGEYEFSKPCKFINKNTLSYTGIQLSSYIKDVTFKRKS